MAVCHGALVIYREHVMLANKILTLLHFKTSLKLVSCILLVIAADVFFYKDISIGGVRLFSCLLLLIAMAHHHRKIVTYPAPLLAWTACVLLVVGQIETVNSLISILCALTLFAFAYLIHNSRANDCWKFVAVTFAVFFVTSWRSLRLVPRLCKRIFNNDNQKALLNRNR